MRKTLLAAAAILSMSGALRAQDNGFTLVPNPADDISLTYTMSPNGRYVGGYTFVNNQGVVYDTQTKTLKIFGEPQSEGTADIRNISNDGKFQILFGGSNGEDHSYFYSFDSMEPLADYGDGSLAKGVSVGGDLVVGCMMNEDGANWNACYWDGTTPVFLPEPSDKWTGWVSNDASDPRVVNGSSADFVSADKSIICGTVIDNMATYPAVVWRLNRDGKTYSVDLICKKYFDQEGDGSKPYDLFTPNCMSEDGKWIGLTMAKLLPDGWNAVYGFGRYNTDTDELETFFYNEEDAIAESYASSIANDGTIVGFVGGRQAEKGVLWKAGESAPFYLAEKYVGVPQFAEYDDYGGHMPGFISADGRYITGFGAYYRDNGTEDESDDEAGTESYIFDLQNENALTAIEGAPAVDKKAADRTVAARYDMSGRRMQNRVAGINILKMRSGKSVKTMEK